MNLDYIKKGAYIEARDNGRWYLAKILEYNKEELKILIHFKGWNSKFDEWKKLIDNDNIRLAKINQDNLKDFEVGDLVLARWSQKFEYTPAKIISLNAESKTGYLEVVFVDKTKKIVRSVTIKHLDSKYDLKGYLNSLNLNIDYLKDNTKSQAETNLPFTDIDMILNLHELSEKWLANDSFLTNVEENINNDLVENLDDIDEEDIPLAQYQSLVVAQKLKLGVSTMPETSVKTEKLCPKIKTHKKEFKDIIKKFSFKKIIDNEVSQKKHKSYSQQDMQNSCLIDDIDTTSYPIERESYKLNQVFPGHQLFTYHYLLGKPFQETLLPSQYRVSCLKNKQKEVVKPKEFSNKNKRSNRYNCMRPSCTKVFRNAYLLESHLKHFHGLDPAQINSEESFLEDDRISYLSSSASSYDGDRDMDPEVKLMRRMKDRKKLHKYARIDHHFFEGRKRKLNSLYGNSPTNVINDREMTSTMSSTSKSPPPQSHVYKKLKTLLLQDNEDEVDSQNMNNGPSMVNKSLFPTLKKARISFNNKAFFLNKKRQQPTLKTITTNNTSPISQSFGPMNNTLASLEISSFANLPGDAFYLDKLLMINNHALPRKNIATTRSFVPTKGKVINISPIKRGIKRPISKIPIQSYGKSVPPPITAPPSPIRPLKRAKILMPFDPNAPISLNLSPTKGGVTTAKLNSESKNNSKTKKRSLPKSNIDGGSLVKAIHKLPEPTDDIPKSIITPDVIKTELNETVNASSVIGEEDEEGEEDDSTVIDASLIEIVHCTCGYNEEDGLMMQCDVCLCWQHSACLGYSEDATKSPNHHICWFCLHPKGGIQSRLDNYIHLNWLNPARLAKIENKFKQPIVPESAVNENKVQTNHDLVFKEAYNLESKTLTIGLGLRNLRIRLANLNSKQLEKKLLPERGNYQTSAPIQNNTFSPPNMQISIPAVDTNSSQTSHPLTPNNNIQKMIDDLLLSPTSLNGNNVNLNGDLFLEPQITTPLDPLNLNSSELPGDLLTFGGNGVGNSDGPPNNLPPDLNFNLMLLQEAAAAISNGSNQNFEANNVENKDGQVIPATTNKDQNVKEETVKTIDEWDVLNQDEMCLENQLDKIDQKLSELENNPFFLFDPTSLSTPAMPYHNHNYAYDNRQHYSNPLANYDPVYPPSRIKHLDKVSVLNSVDLYGIRKALVKLENQIKRVSSTNLPFYANNDYLETL